MSNEADTCRKYVLPKLVDAGWDNEPHRFNEQVTFTDGRIVLAGNKVKRRPSAALGEHPYEPYSYKPRTTSAMARQTRR